MKLAQMDVISCDASPTIWENLNVHTPSMPSTGLWLSGKPREYANQSRSEPLGCWLLIGLVNYDNFSPTTSTAPRTTTPLYKLLPLVLYSQNSLRSWTVYATTKKRLPGGLTARPQSVHARPFGHIHLLFINLINTRSSTATICVSPMHLLHPLLQVHFRTKSFHHQEKYTLPYAQLCRHGLQKTHSHHCQKYTLTSSGNGPSTPTTLHSTTTSHTRTLHASNSSSRRPSFTMKTNVLHPCESIAPWSTSSVSPRPSPTHWFFEHWKIAPTTLSRRPSPRSPSNLANPTPGLLVLVETYRMPTSYPNAKNNSWQVDRLSASLQHLFDLCWIASPRWSTTFYHKLFPTTLQKEMSSISSSSSKTPILTISLHHVYTIRTLLASSRASTLRGSSTAGDSPCSFFLPSWAQTRTKSFRWRQPRATPQEMLSKDVRAVPWMWPERSLFVILNASFWCPWRWPSSPSAPQSMNKFEAHPWVPLWAQLFAWWSSPFRKKSGTEPTAPPWPQWTFQPACFAMWTTDFVLQTLPGTTKSLLPTFCTRSSTETQSSWKRSRIRSFLAFALSSNPSHYATALHVTSTKLWHHFRRHLWLCNYQVSSPDFFWSPNVRTLPRNGLEVLPPCIVCTEQQVFVNPI